MMRGLLFCAALYGEIYAVATCNLLAAVALGVLLAALYIGGDKGGEK